MHIVSDKRLQRSGYSYTALPAGGFVGYPTDTKPHVNWRHIDGPLLYCSSGKMHWLTLRERVRLFLGLDSIESINERRG